MGFGKQAKTLTKGQSGGLKKPAREPYTASDVKLLRQHSRARAPVSKIARLMKRSEGSLRQKALKLGVGLGHQR